MATITRTVTAFSTIEAAMILAAGTLGTLRTLDLTTKDGATLYVRMGRRVTTALTRSAYVAIRKTDNNTIVFPDTRYDVPSQTAACAATTLNGSTTIGAASIVVNNASGFSVGDIICISDGTPTAIEYARIYSISSNTLSLDSNLRMAHANTDAVTNLADVCEVNLPGGDLYEIRCVNNSGYAITFAVDAAVETGATVT